MDGCFRRFCSSRSFVRSLLVRSFVRGAVAAGRHGAGRMTELNLRGVLGIEGAAPAALACLPASRPPLPSFPPELLCSSSSFYHLRCNKIYPQAPLALLFCPLSLHFPFP